MQPSWHAGIDSRFAARLVRRPGMLGLGLARRIMRGVEAMTTGLPLLARFQGKVQELGGHREPIVHAEPIVPNVAVKVAAPAPVVTARVVERTNTLERIIERSVREVEAQRTLVPTPSAGPTATSPVTHETPPRVQPAAIPRPEIEATPPPVRRTRVGAPIVPETSAPVSPAQPKRVAAAPPAPVVVAPKPHASLVVIPRSVAADVPAAPVVAPAPRKPRSASEPLIEHRELPHPIVAPRVVTAQRVRPSELSHVEPLASRATVASTASPVSAPQPSVASRPAPPLASVPAKPVIDLNQLAERVQGILERQAIHARARRGMR